MPKTYRKKTKRERGRRERLAEKWKRMHLKQMEDRGELPNYPNRNDRLKQIEETGEKPNGFGNTINKIVKEIKFLIKLN
jgi:hypothetical protein